MRLALRFGAGDRGRNSDPIGSEQTSRRDFDRMLRKLPDRQNRAQDEDSIKQGFKQAAVFLFRFGTDQESVSGFFVWVFHRGLFGYINPLCTRRAMPQLEVIYGLYPARYNAICLKSLG